MTWNLRLGWIALGWITLAMLSVTGCGEDPARLRCPAGAGCGFTQVSAGFQHTCALHTVVSGGSEEDYGQVVCWGDNGALEGTQRSDPGRLGAPTGLGVTKVAEPVVVAGLDDVLQVSAGGWHTCALRAGGRVSCWGSNRFGELGNGGREGSLTPTDVSMPEEAGEIVEIWTGATMSDENVRDGERIQSTVTGGTACALDDQEQVFCWGKNQGGQVSALEALRVVRPAALPALDGARDVALGHDFGCAVVGSQVRCWGGVRQEGDAQVATYDLASNPQRQSAVGPAEEVSATGFWACARETSGDVRCWTEPTNMLAVEFSGATRIAVGRDHACAVDGLGRVTCWGENDTGQLGLPPAVGTFAATTPVEDENGNPLRAVRDLSAGRAHTCLIDSARVIRCFGANNFGQLGNGAFDPTHVAMPVVTEGL